MRSFFGKKAAVPTCVKSPSREPTERSCLERTFDFRPGDWLSEGDLALFSSSRTLEPFEGYEVIGLFWEGASLHLSPDKRVECIDMTRKPDGIYGLVQGTSAEEMLRLFPSMIAAGSRYLDRSASEHLIFYHALLPEGDIELLTTTRGGVVVRLALARAGYWADPQRVSREARREQAAVEQLAMKEAHLKSLQKNEELRDSRRNRWKDIADPDEMLKIWADEAADNCKDLATRLSAAPPSEWASIAERLNFDDGLAPLFWIVRQSKAEVSDIFDIFALCEPDYFCDPKNQRSTASSMNERELIDEIRRRVDAGFYRVSESFDGVAAWDHVPLGRRDAAFFDPYRHTFRRMFNEKR